MSDDQAYLEPDFDPNALTVAQLVGILTHHGVIDNSRTYGKKELLKFWKENITPNQEELNNQRLERQGSQASDAGSHSVNGVTQAPLEDVRAPAFGEGNPSLTLVNGKDIKDPLKRRKPKSNIVKSNSSFVSRVIPHEALSKRLQEHDPKGLFAFANVNRALQWLDLSSPTKVLFPGSQHFISTRLTRHVGRAYDQDSFHQGARHLPRCEPRHQKLESSRHRNGLLYR